jgi:hypothetical protein
MYQCSSPRHPQRMSTCTHDEAELLLLDDNWGGVLVARPTVRDRFSAILHSDRIDSELAQGASPDADLARALRARRLTSTRTRRALASGLGNLIGQAKTPTAGAFSSVPLQRGRVLAALDDLEQLQRCLLVAGPIAVRGVALTKELLTDGSGPLYSRAGREDLGHRVRAAIDAMELAGIISSGY